MTHSWDYLLYGRWLVVWAALGVWFGAHRAMSRWKQLAAWSAVGVCLAIALCSPRLRAEYYWTAAQSSDLRGDFSSARDSVRAAVNVFPELERLQRTWLLIGKLDYLESRSTPAEAIFRAAQLAARSSSADDTDHEREDAATRLRRAVETLEPVVPQDTDEGTVARALQARILIDAGVALYLRQPRFTEAGLDYSDQKRDLVTALETWQRAMRLDPSRLDGRIYLSLAQPLVDPDRPERAHPNVAVADRLLEADVLNLTGDAYFDAGLLTEARRFYAASLDLLNLPQRKNFRAQKGLGGL